MKIRKRKAKYQCVGKCTLLQTRMKLHERGILTMELKSFSIINIFHDSKVDIYHEI